MLNINYTSKDGFQVPTLRIGSFDDYESNYDILQFEHEVKAVNIRLPHTLITDKTDLFIEQVTQVVNARLYTEYQGLCGEYVLKALEAEDKEHEVYYEECHKITDWFMAKYDITKPSGTLEVDPVAKLYGVWLTKGIVSFELATSFYQLSQLIKSLDTHNLKLIDGKRVQLDADEKATVQALRESINNSLEVFKAKTELHHAIRLGLSDEDILYFYKMSGGTITGNKRKVRYRGKGALKTFGKDFTNWLIFKVSRTPASEQGTLEKATTK